MNAVEQSLAASPSRRVAESSSFIERIIEASARNKFLVFILALFAIAAGFYGLYHTSLDAIPDLSDAQVIVYTDWEGRSPDLVEDQISYPISTLFIAAPKVKFVRGESMFGKSFVYVIFEDGTDIYWARSRVIEYLNSLRGSLPEGVNPVIGPDATGVGWVYEYALVDDSEKHNLAELRSIQDWNLRFALESVKGVSEVASVGGFVKEYQVDLDPNALVAYHIPLSDVVRQIKASNGDVGGPGGPAAGFPGGDCGPKSFSANSTSRNHAASIRIIARSAGCFSPTDITRTCPSGIQSFAMEATIAGDAFGHFPAA
jgi:Cu(I)/Ag(I) efflux system membrane protein CusA/SilA